MLFPSTKCSPFEYPERRGPFARVGALGPSIHLGAQSPFARVFSPLSVCPLAVYGVGETAALPGENHNTAVVDKTVNEYSGQAVVSKDGVPLRELQI